MEARGRKCGRLAEERDEDDRDVPLARGREVAGLRARARAASRSLGRDRYRRHGEESGRSGFDQLVRGVASDRGKSRPGKRRRAEEHKRGEKDGCEDPMLDPMQESSLESPVCRKRLDASGG